MSVGAALKMRPLYVPERTITIENGDVIPADKDVYVKPRAIVKFSNLDSKSYTITFLVHDQDPFDLWPRHADVDLFLPAFGSATMTADPDVLVGQCNYLVEETAPSSVGRTTANKIEETLINEAAASSDPPPLQPRQLVVRSTSRGGGGGTIHIGG